MEVKETEGMELQENLAATTTTALAATLWQNMPNPCKFRGHTLEILEALYDCGNLTTREIANITGMTMEMVKLYCKNGRKNCIITKIDRWKWSITEYGNFIYLININNIKKGITNGYQTDNKRITNGYRTFNSEKKQHQLNLSIFEQNEDLSEEQRIVVVALANHYEKSAKFGTPRPYLKVKDYYQFRVEVGLPSKLSDEDVQDIVISLEVMGILFKWPEGKRLKIGLTKRTIENMKNV